MAEFTITNEAVFPVGTEVEAYPASNWPTPTPPSGTPLGEAADAQTMESGSLTFEGLESGVSYWAVAEVGGTHRYVAFLTAVPATGSVPSEVMEYRGAWDAESNSPELADGIGDAGDAYRVSEAGEQDLGSGTIDFKVGDLAIYNGEAWEKGGASDAVESVNGETGAVELTAADVEALTQAQADELYAPQVPGLVAPVLAAGSLVIQANMAVITNRRYVQRVIIPRSGKLRDIAVYQGAQSGNIRVAVYDTGDAAAGKRTRLWESGSVATPAANGWRVIGDPDLDVVAGQQLDLIVCYDNNTATIGRYAVAFSAASVVLPVGFNPLPGGASPKLAASAGDSFTMPATFDEANLEGANSSPCIIGRIT